MLDEQKRIRAIARQCGSTNQELTAEQRCLSAAPFLQSLPPQLNEPIEQWQRRLSLLPIGLARQTYQGISLR